MWDLLPIYARQVLTIPLLTVLHMYKFARIFICYTFHVCICVSELWVLVVKVLSEILAQKKTTEEKSTIYFIRIIYKMIVFVYRKAEV